MAIVQDTFFVPDDIATGLATGLYRRFGGVIRYAAGPNKGQIVKHLQPANLKAAEQAQGIVAKAMQFVATHKKEVGIAAIGVIIAGAGIGGYTVWKNHEPKVLTKFRSTLNAYIEAIRTGKMDIEKIDNLMEALESLKIHKNYNKISIQLTTEDLEILVERIYEYTIKLAQDNCVDLSDGELCPSGTNRNGAIINLQQYLQVQKKVFETTA